MALAAVSREMGWDEMDDADPFHLSLPDRAPSPAAQHTQHTAHSTHSTARAVLGRGSEIAKKTDSELHCCHLPARPEETTKNSSADGQRNHSLSILPSCPSAILLLWSSMPRPSSEHFHSGGCCSRYSRCSYPLRLRAIDAPPLVAVDSMSCRDRQDILLGYLRLTAKQRQ